MSSNSTERPATETVDVATVKFIADRLQEHGDRAPYRVGEILLDALAALPPQQQDAVREWGVRHGDDCDWGVRIGNFRYQSREDAVRAAEEELCTAVAVPIGPTGVLEPVEQQEEADPPLEDWELKLIEEQEFFGEDEPADRLEILSENDILKRRDELLASVGMTEEKLRERGSFYALTPREAGILAEIDGLDFLLGGCVSCGHDSPHRYGGIGICGEAGCVCDGPVRRPVDWLDEPDPDHRPSGVRFRHNTRSPAADPALMSNPEGDNKILKRARQIAADRDEATDDRFSVAEIEAAWPEVERLLGFGAGPILVRLLAALRAGRADTTEAQQ